jgi:tetraacyldisaccharide 4'-kinase
LAIDPTRHTARAVGDEPLLMAAFAPVWVARDRAEGVRVAENANADVVLLDDGFQNPFVAKDLSIVVVDAAVGFGNGYVIPAGPLREPVAAGLARASAVLSVGGAEDQDRFRTSWGHGIKVPHLTAVLEPLPTGLPLKGARVLAFAGIARPKRFFDTLHSLGADVLRAEALGDHQTLTSALMTRLEAEARALGAQMVTTEKDAVRLPASFRKKVMTLPVRLRFHEETALADLLKSVLDV